MAFLVCSLQRRGRLLLNRKALHGALRANILGEVGVPPPPSPRMWCWFFVSRAPLQSHSIPPRTRGWGYPVRFATEPHSDTGRSRRTGWVNCGSRRGSGEEQGLSEALLRGQPTPRLERAPWPRAVLLGVLGVRVNAPERPRCVPRPAWRPSQHPTLDLCVCAKRGVLWGCLAPSCGPLPGVGALQLPRFCSL